MPSPWHGHERDQNHSGACKSEAERQIGLEGRRQAETRFSLNNQIGRFEDLYDHLAGKDQR